MSPPSWTSHHCPLSFQTGNNTRLRREAWEGLQPLINKFLACGLLVSTSSPYNTLILSVKKKDRTWWMVQDLWIINEAVVPLHPTVLYPYVNLGEIPPSAKWFTQSWISKMHCFAYHWLNNPNIFLPSSGRLQEKNTNRWLRQYHLKGSEIAPTCLDRLLARIS